MIIISSCNNTSENKVNADGMAEKNDSFNTRKDTIRKVSQMTVQFSSVFLKTALRLQSPAK